MTSCPYCFTPGAYDSGFRVECKNVSCEHYSAKWTGATSTDFVSKYPATETCKCECSNCKRFGSHKSHEFVRGGFDRDGQPACPTWFGPYGQAVPSSPAEALATNSRYGKLKPLSPEELACLGRPEPELLVPEDSLPPGGSGRRIFATPAVEIPAGVTSRLVARPQMSIRIEEVLIVSSSEALLHLIDFRIGCDSQFVASNSPIPSDLLAKTPLRVDRPAHCATDVVFDITNPSCYMVRAQGICFIKTEADFATEYTDTEYTDTEIEGRIFEAVQAERERIAKMIREYGRSRVPTAESWWKQIVAAILRGSTTL